MIVVQSQDPSDEFLFQQFRLVEDPDGKTNVRSGASLESGVLRTVASGSVVTVVEKQGDWYSIREGNYDGSPEFIHASRLRDASHWNRIATSSSAGATGGTLRHKGFVARVTALPFVAADHDITELSDGLFEVDGGMIRGTDGGLPRNSIGLTVALAGVPLSLPAEAPLIFMSRTRSPSSSSLPGTLRSAHSSS